MSNQPTVSTNVYGNLGLHLWPLIWREGRVMLHRKRRIAADSRRRRPWLRLWSQGVKLGSFLKNRPQDVRASFKHWRAIVRFTRRWDKLVACPKNYDSNTPRNHPRCIEGPASYRPIKRRVVIRVAIKGSGPHGFGNALGVFRRCFRVLALTFAVLAPSWKHRYAGVWVSMGEYAWACVSMQK